MVGIPRSLAQAKPTVNWCPKIERLLASMLAKEAADRPESCQAILDVLEGGLRDETLAALSQPLAAPADPADDGGLFNNFFKMLGR